MSEFFLPPAVTTLKLIKDYVIAGDIELLEDVDFGEFRKKDLIKIRKDAEHYLHHDIDDRVTNYNELVEDIQQCIDYLEEQIGITHQWVLQSYIIHAECFGDCVHKVYDKTQQYCVAVSGTEIKKLIEQDEKKYIRHFFQKT